MIGVSKEFCVYDVKFNSCLSLFTITSSKCEGRFLSQNLWSNLFCYLHISNFQKVVWNVHGVKRPWGEMYMGEVSLGWNDSGVKCPDTVDQRYHSKNLGPNLNNFATPKINLLPESHNMLFVAFFYHYFIAVRDQWNLGLELDFSPVLIWP